ncbi:hypothetical protein N7520_005603 [Penicillium odoratum]|uniref:uncharacterized protein n=1 Tax=Penicillium odoratum TaxID=1167516 RepID=UPI0025491FBD|nr:uncharacterized protein N7520_005603 [Penicillium odoratum]KAJ5758447.1 hypothetical protein N7520_005603 [Penicillium odoratum]
MRYDRVASSEDEESVKLEATTQVLTPPHPYIKRRCYQGWHLLGLAAIQSVVIVILLILVIVVADRSSSLQDDRSTTMIYGLDRPYMSLNHTYDHLWNETSKSGLVFTEVDGNRDVGAIAMLESHHSLLSNLTTKKSNPRAGFINFIVLLQCGQLCRMLLKGNKSVLIRRMTPTGHTVSTILER